MYFNVNFNVFFKLIKVHQNAQCNDKKKLLNLLNITVGNYGTE